MDIGRIMELDIVGKSFNHKVVLLCTNSLDIPRNMAVVGTSLLLIGVFSRVLESLMKILALILLADALTSI